jgi:hypothetical protein
VSEDPRRFVKVSEVLRRSLEPRNNVQSCGGYLWNVVGLWRCCQESGGMCRSP